MKPIVVLLQLISIPMITAQSPCCDDVQELYNSGKTCKSNGTEIIKFTCNGTLIPVEDPAEIMHTLSGDGKMIDVDGNDVLYCLLTDETNYLVCYKPSTLDVLRRWQDDFYMVLIGISLVFVILTILVYAIVPKLLDLQGICIMHTLIGLGLSYILLLIMRKTVWEWEHSCEAAGFILYTSIMYMYLWQVVLAFHIWRVTVMPNLFKSFNWPIFYHIFGGGGAVICLMVILAAHHVPEHLQEKVGPGFGISSCWFHSHDKTWIFLYGPMLVLILINVILYLWTVWFLWKNVNRATNIRKDQVMKVKVLLCVKHFIVMGFTWIFEIITFSISDYIQSQALIIIFLFLPDLLNLLQGLFLFLLLVVFRKRARRLLATQNIFQLKFPSSWMHLEDEEVYSGDERNDKTVVEYNVVGSEEKL